MSRFLKYFILLIFLCKGVSATGQKYSVSTNFIDYLNLGTLNLEASAGLSQHLGIVAGVKYNPFTFRKGEKDGQFQNRQQAYSIGMRWWGWHVYSGWWLCGKLQYQEYNTGGIFSRRTEEGDRIGLGLSGGYTHILCKHLNLDFGLGFWGGIKKYAVYSCPTCGITRESGIKAFLLPDNITLALCYVF